MISALNKIARDPYYNEVFKPYSSLRLIQEAGFFDDGLAPGVVEDLSDPRWLTTPLSKVKPQAGPRPVVLLTTGAFAPVHEGHIQMMEIARRKMTHEGYTVIGGFMAPAHDSYVSTKGDHAERFPAYLRLEHLNKALTSSDWLAPDPWMAQYTPADLNFTDVLRRLQNYLNTHLKTEYPIEVAYVFGADNAGFARTFLKRGLCVCVTRPGFDEKLSQIKNDPALSSTERIYFVDGNTNISSKEIRMGKLSRMECLREDAPLSKEKATYFIRDDLDWALEPWAKICAPKTLKKAKETFLAGIKDEIEKAFRQTSLPLLPKQIEIISIPAADQQQWLDKNLGEKSFINMDCVTADAGHPVDFSRLFFLSDMQLYLDSLVIRPESEPHEDIFATLKPGDYALVDDDIATGFSMDALEKILPDTIKITERIPLLKCWFKEKFPGRDYTPWDILDARDLLPGSRMGGLVVKSFNGDIVRVPYLSPYVSLSNRSSIPQDQQESMSAAIYKLSQSFFETVGDGILLKHADPSFARLMRSIGFQDEMKMSSLCAWHVEKLAAAMSNTNGHKF